MNTYVRKALLASSSKEQRIKIGGYIGDDPDRFQALMTLFLGDDRDEGYRITQRAAGVLSEVIEKHPALIQPYLAQTIALIAQPGKSDTVVRNSLRLLEFVDIPEHLQGLLMDICFRFIADHEAAIAVKAFSLGILHSLSNQYPEILPELVTIIQARWDNESPAFKSRARKILAGAGIRR